MQLIITIKILMVQYKPNQKIIDHPKFSFKSGIETHPVKGKVWNEII